jgi:hypothetical protein
MTTFDIGSPGLMNSANIFIRKKEKWLGTDRLRNQCRSLKYDLYRKHIIDCKSSMGVTSLLEMLDIISHI